MPNLSKLRKQILLVKTEIYNLQCMGIDLDVSPQELNSAYDRVCDFEEELNTLTKKVI